jgi:hypothetical protein
MQPMQELIAGVFKDRDAADRTVAVFRAAGVPHEAVSVHVVPVPVWGTFRDIGIPEEQVRAIEPQLAAGDVVVVVRGGLLPDEARAIISQHGGRPLESGVTLRRPTG